MARYGKAAGKSVKSAMHREKRGTLRSGKGGKGGKVTSRKQAIAIGLSEARKKGVKVPQKKSYGIQRGGIKSLIGEAYATEIKGLHRRFRVIRARRLSTK